MISLMNYCHIINGIEFQGKRRETRYEVKSS